MLPWSTGTTAGAVAALAAFALGPPPTSATGQEIPVRHAAKLSDTTPVDAADIYAGGQVRTSARCRPATAGPARSTRATNVCTHAGRRYTPRDKKPVIANAAITRELAGCTAGTVPPA